MGRAASRGGRGHAGAGRGRQADPGREPQRGRRLLRDRDAGHARRPPAREPLLPRPGGEIAALRALLEDVDLRGCVVTLDPLHSTRDTERAIVETHGADYVLSIKTNCPDTFSQLAAIDWDAPAVRRHADPPAKGHGRIEARRIAARDLLPGTFAAFAGARQAFRVIRERTDAKTGETSVETAYGITSVPAERAGPERLLAWNRGHWQVENGNHYRRDATMGEDASRIRARHAPANNATLNNIALAIVFHRGFRYLPEANLHFMMRRSEALDAILEPR